jgi:hypothetical protein
MARSQPLGLRIAPTAPLGVTKEILGAVRPPKPLISIVVMVNFLEES